MTTNMQAILEAVEQAATKNDRYLFLLVLVVLGAVVFFAARWLIGRYEALMVESRADQQQYSMSLLNITAEVNKTNKELAVVVDRCAKALDDTSAELKLCRERKN